MENYVAELDRLIDLKKSNKKKPNKKEKASFLENWLILVKAEGFSEKAEAYLYDGFIYAGAKPFQAYLNSAENQIETLGKLYSGKLYCNNCRSTTQLVVYLLSLSLNEAKDCAVVISLLMQIPKIVLNKEGKMFGRAEDVFRKFFFEILNPDVKLPAIEEINANGFDNETVKKLENIFNEIIGKIDKSCCSEVCKKNMERLAEWLRSEIEKPVNPHKSDEPLSLEEKIKDLNDKLHKAEEQLKDCTVKLRRAEVKIIQSAHEQKILAREKQAVEDKIAALNKTLEGKENQIAQQGEMIAELNKANSALQNKLQLSEEQANQSKNELAELEGLLGVLQKNNQKQSEAKLKRLGQKLTTYYEDFLDIKDLEMSIELGESLRIQLESLFEFLTSSGITIGEGVDFND